jgi:hypothetical protein
VAPLSHFCAMNDRKLSYLRPDRAERKNLRGAKCAEVVVGITPAIRSQAIHTSGEPNGLTIMTSKAWAQSWIPCPRRLLSNPQLSTDQTGAWSVVREGGRPPSSLLRTVVGVDLVSP